MTRTLYQLILIVLSGLSTCAVAVAQTTKQIDERSQLWTAYFTQTRFSEHWGLWTDLHIRTKDNLVQDFSSGIVRVGLMYYLNDHTKLTAGYAYVNHFPEDGHAFISQPEHRPWQQIQWHNNGPKARLTHWVRLEERFRRRIRNDRELAEGYNYGTRVRYNLLAAFPLGPNAFKPGGVSLVLNDEVHLNLGRKVIYNHFDQNRFFVGLGFQLGRHTALQTGYMNVFQQLASGNRYRNLHTARVFLFQTFDKRKSKKN